MAIGTHPPLRCDWQGAFAGQQRPRDFHKRSYAAANPLEEGEVRGHRKSSKASKTRAKATEPGRLVFLSAEHRARSNAANRMHPHVIVRTEPRRLEGMNSPAYCVTLRPLPVDDGVLDATRAASEVTVAASEVVGLSVDFRNVWEEHVSTGSLLETAMRQAVEMFRLRQEPHPTFSSAWRAVAQGLPEPEEKLPQG
eukprot:Transcript_12737.p2 GENE.Transcript_12737~~Transcript_12737.p2  ORF type:complete len:196 (+),score=26.94 Transcript_12737:609-1196(+)